MIHQRFWMHELPENFEIQSLGIGQRTDSKCFLDLNTQILLGSTDVTKKRMRKMILLLKFSFFHQPNESIIIIHLRGQHVRTETGLEIRHTQVTLYVFHLADKSFLF